MVTRGVALIVALLGIACVLFVLSVASNAFDSSADSDPGTYIAVGGPFLIFGAVALYAGIGVFRRGRL
jgi:hypothetical protein